MARTGRPPIISQVVGTRTDPNTGAEIDVTHGDRIIAALRAGTSERGACGAAGIPLETFRDWMKAGTRLQRRLHNEPGFNRAKMSRRERDLADFSDQAARAICEWETAANAQLEKIQRGGQKHTTVTVKMEPDGHGGWREVDRTEKTEEQLPNPSIILQRLRMRLPADYAETSRHEHSGPDGEPITIEHRASQIAEAARQWQAQQRQLPEGT